VRYSARINGTTGLALMLLDVLSEFDELKLCRDYAYKGETLSDFPASLDTVAACAPLYLTLPGWKRDITGCRDFDDLPEAAQNYIRAVEEITGVPVKIVSVGPDREQTIVRETIF
jgi:adenylosuccinate synthase